MDNKPNYVIPIVGVIVAILAVAGIIVFALSQSKTGQQTQTTAPTTPSQPTSSPNPETGDKATFTYTDRGFEPATLTVKAGTTVTVRNDSSHPMQFSSADHPTHRLNTELNLDTISPGSVATFTPTRVGTWGIHDHLQPDHTATITVVEK